MALSAVLSGTHDAATFLEMNWKVGHRKYSAENEVGMGTAGMWIPGKYKRRLWEV